MEIFSNLAWLAACIAVLGLAAAQIRHGRSRTSTRATLTAAFALCFILLPVISMTDDLLASRQNSLPLSGQTWHLAAEAPSIGEIPIPFFAESDLLRFLALPEPLPATGPLLQDARPHTARLIRSLRLRPPPATVA